jgi:glycosyltransferase involved in cell wall biosynthesis
MTKVISPKVSVCIPVYNGSDYIAESIDSVLAQNFKDFELIVCDNCSTDNTEEIVRNYKDSRVRYFRNQKNLGYVGNANRCLELAAGEYISIWHHDDCMMPDNLERKVRLLDEHPDVGFVHSNLVLIDVKGEIVSQNIWNEDSRHDYIKNGMVVFREFMSYLPNGASIFIGAVLARRECYALVGGFSPELPHCDDSEMWMRMALFYNVACIGTPLVKYREHPASTTRNWGNNTSITYLNEHYLAAQMVFEKHSDRIPQANRLKQQVSRSFGERAMTWAYNAFSDGDFSFGRICFKEALKMCLPSYNDKLFWKVMSMYITGPIGLKFYHFLKKSLLKESM